MLARSQAAAPLGVEIRGGGRHGMELVEDLVGDDADIRLAVVAQRDARVLAKRHLPVAPAAAVRRHDHRQGRHRVRLRIEAHREEIPERRLDRRRLLIVPVHPQHERAEFVGAGRDPELVDAAGALDVGERGGLAGLEADKGTDLPAAAEVLGRAAMREEGIGGIRVPAGGSAFFAGGILGVDHARDRAGLEGQLPEEVVHGERGKHPSPIPHPRPTPS
jgi:hypothetical protein